MGSVRYLSAAAALVILAFAAPLFATTFVVPTDTELIEKSDAIVVGTIEGSYVERDGSEIRTVYEMRISRSVKGAAARPGQILRFVSPGGELADEAVVVAGAAHFRQGQRAVLFLIFEEGRWHPTDMTLGRFLFATSTAGERLLVREVDDAAVFDREGRPHREPVRREERFIRFIEERVAGRRPADDYSVEAATVSLAEEPVDQRFALSSNAAVYPPRTYTDNVNGGSGYMPARWPNIAAGVPFHKKADQNISGAPDGGVGAIQSGLAAWTNECGSVINLTYAGTTTTASKNFDTVHVVEYNDPQNRVPGSWGGAGTIATTFTSYGNPHQFAGEQWWSITDADVVFQNGYPATHASFATAMTHELGHAIGWRHSNAHYIRNADYTDAPCNSVVEECTSAAIMNAVSGSAYGFTLQPWDVHAAQAVYPGGSCGPIGPTAPEGVGAVAVSATQIRVTWAGVGGATSYDIFRRSPGSPAFVKIGSSTTTTYIDTVSADTAYLYRVVAVNSGGSSLPSGVDLATSVVFTDDPLRAGVIIKAAHLEELRRAVNAVRRLAGLPNATFTDPAQPGVVVKAVHILELRTALDAARLALGIPNGTWTEVVAPGVIVRARHFEEIRERVR